MNNTCCRVALACALMSVWAAGCATQEVPGVAGAQAGKPVASAPQAAVVTSTPAVVAAAHDVKPLPAPSALEMQYGIQIAQLGVTASGGLVDVRFKVLDAAKARKLLGNPANAPMLIAGDKPPLMAPHHALRGAKFGQGQVFYILYPNLRNAIQPGVEVTVAMGDARIGPVTAH